MLKHENCHEISENFAEIFNTCLYLVKAVVLSFNFSPTLPKKIQNS